MTETRSPALQHWGDYDLDDPFPLFAEVLEPGPVHDVTLADGHRAFLVVGYDAAREALNHPDLSKDMEAALDAERRRRRRGPAGPATSRGTCSASTRPTTAGSRRLATPALHPRPAGRRSRTGSPRPSSRCSTTWRRRRARSTWWPAFALPLPFAVIGELLGIDPTVSDGWPAGSPR